MKLEGTYTFNAPRDVVWNALMDPDVLARVMPGCEKLEQIGENQYQGAIKIRVGPVQGKFNGQVQLADINEPDSYTMTVDGKGAPGFMKGEGHVRLEAQGDSTLMHYSGQAQVGGKIASVGQRLLDSSAKALTKQSLDGLKNQIEARVQAGGDDNASEEVKPDLPPPAEAPSQTQFAVGVAKNMLDDALPANRMPLYIGIGLAALVVIVLLVWAYS